MIIFKPNLLRSLRDNQSRSYCLEVPDGMQMAYNVINGGYVDQAIRDADETFVRENLVLAGKRVELQPA